MEGRRGKCGLLYYGSKRVEAALRAFSSTATCTLGGVVEDPLRFPDAGTAGQMRLGIFPARAS
jgi:hypothetical protein